jgi:hypothetical protein
VSQHPSGQRPEPPPSYGPPGSQRGGPSKGALVAAVLVVVLAIGGAVAGAVLLLQGADDATTASPQGTAELWAEAWGADDCEGLTELMTDEFAADGSSGDCDDPLVGVPGNPEISDQTELSATAAIPLAGDGGSTTMYLALVKHDREWLVADFCLAGYDGPCKPVSG